MIGIEPATRAQLAWAQLMVTAEHYLHAPVDPRCAPFGYIVTVEHAAMLPQVVGCLIFGRPEATRCYDGGLTYGSLADVQAGRAQYDRWELLNLARVWLSPHVQTGGIWHRRDLLPGYVDRRGRWRSTLASHTIELALARIGYDYLQARPPVDCAYPYQIRAVLSYCDTHCHKGTIYRAAGFQRARTNARGIETWYTPAVAPLMPEQDRAVRQLAETAPRSQQIRARRNQLALWADPVL